MSFYQPGQLLGRYKIVRVLGSGAMGDVYLAEDPQIERQLAIKTVRVVGSQPHEVEDRKRRLLREARAAGKMVHPNVVTLFDAGEQDGSLYLAFEFVGGSDLAARLETPPPLTLGQMLRIVRETAEALDFAHRQGIVHRDIKPSNILLDTEGRVKVGDFGIAKMVGQSTELTMTGSVVGSPHYLSPEQVRGEELDGRTDVYSLGVVFYEMLSLKRPFEGETLTTLVYQILNKDPAPLLQLRPDIAPRLEGLLRRMMAKDRDQRFATAGEAAAEVATVERSLSPEVLALPLAPAESDALEPTRRLEGFSTVLPAVTPPPAAGASAPRRSRAGRVVGLALAVVVVLAGAAVVTWKVLGPKPAAPLSTTSEVKDEPAAQATPPVEKGVASVPETTTSTKTAATGPAERPPVSSSAEREPAAASPHPGSQTSHPESQPPVQQPTAVAPEHHPPVPEPGLRTAPAAPVPAARAPRDEEKEEATEPSSSSGRRHDEAGPVDNELSTGMVLGFQVQPADAFVLIDGTVIGRASDLGRSGYTLADPGDHLVVLRGEGMSDYRIRVHAGAGGPAKSQVIAHLKRRDAAELTIGDLQRYQVRESVAFKVEPAGASVVVDGATVGPASKWSGGFGRSGWLELPIGTHRVGLVAPGRKRVDFAVEVSAGAEKKRDKIEIVLPVEHGG